MMNELIGKSWSLNEILDGSFMAKDRAMVELTSEQWDAFFTRILEIAKGLYEPSCKSISQSAIRRLTTEELSREPTIWGEQLLPIDQNLPEQQKVEQYKKAFDNFMKLYNDVGRHENGGMASTRYGGVGAEVKREWTKLLKSWGMWRKKEGTGIKRKKTTKRRRSK